MAQNMELHFSRKHDLCFHGKPIYVYKCLKQNNVKQTNQQ